MRSSVVEPGRAPREAGPARNMNHSSPYRVPYYQAVPPLRKNVGRTWKNRWKVVLVPEEGWLVFCLLAIALYCVVFSIIAARWVTQSQALLLTPVVGLLVGLSIAKIPRLPQAILHLAACLLGYWFSIFLTSFISFRTSWVVLLGGLRATLSGNISALTPTASMMVFFFYLSFLCFFLGYFGSWLVYRARLPWLVVLVYSSIMLVNLNYLNVSDNHRYLMVVMLGALLLLVARLNLVSQISAWRLEGLYTDRAWIRSITLRFMRVATLMTFVVMLFSIILPVQQQTSSGKAIWDRLNGSWGMLVGGRFSAPAPGSFMSGTPSSNFFSDQLTISGNVQLPAGEVLYYSSDISHYLQGFAYNSFDGHTWKIAPVSLQDQFYAAGQALPVQDAGSLYNRMGTTVTIELPPGGTRNYIFAPSQPINFSVDTQVYSLSGVANAWTQPSPLEKGKSYTVTSDVLAAPASMLQQVPLPHDNLVIWKMDQSYQQVAGVDLQLPNDLSPTVATLAHQWTQGATDTYMALRDLENHLSDTNVFTYSTDNPPIPANEDVVDYLLKNHRGYCTHYATAMVMMARILGIPTRMMNGFSRGHYDLQRRVWLVDGSDAHSWVQAYFPGYGWVDFDPTPGYSLHANSVAPNPTPQPTVTRPQPTPRAQMIPPPPPLTPPAVQNTMSAHQPLQASKPLNSFGQMLLIWLSVLILFCSLLLFLVALVTRWWRNLYANSTFVTGTFWRLCRLASWAGLAPKGWQTPYEYSSMLRRQLPQSSAPFQHLTELFVRDRWGPPQVAPRPHEEADIQQCWPSLRTELVWHIFRRREKR